MFLKKDMLDGHIKKVHGFKNQSSLMEVQKIKEDNPPEGKFLLNYLLIDDYNSLSK